MTIEAVLWFVKYLFVFGSCYLKMFMLYFTNIYTFLSITKITVRMACIYIPNLGQFDHRFGGGLIEPWIGRNYGLEVGYITDMYTKR